MSIRLEDKEISKGARLLELISRFVLHVDSYFLLSNYSKLFIQWLLTGLALYALVMLVWKSVDQRKANFYVGFAVRIMLLVGVSVEMLHQVQATELTQVFANSYGPVRQFLSFMFFGYIIVVGFFYMITINDRTNKGMFYTFDILVLSLPILHTITSFIIYVTEFGVVWGDVIGFLLVLSVIVSALFLFFKGYWKPRALTLVPFYFLVGVALIPMVLDRINRVAINNLSELSNLFIFLGLLMTYHLLASGEHQYLEKIKVPFTGVTAVLFLLLINPAHNLGDVALANTTAQVQLRYFEEVDLVTLEEAVEKAVRLTGESNFYYEQRTHEDFHNIYRLESENYLVDIDGVSGLIRNLHRQTPTTGETLEKEEYGDRSLRLLESIGRELLPEEQLTVTVTTLNRDQTNSGNERVKVVIAPKFSDGSLFENDRTYFVWEKEDLIEFHELDINYSVETLRNTAVSTEDIDAIIREWYELMERPTPAYVLESVFYGYSNRTIELIYRTTDDDRLVIDGRKGEVIDYFGNFDADYEALEEKIVEALDLKEDEWRRERFQSAWHWYKKERDPSKLQTSYSFGYYAGGEFFSFSKGMDLAGIPLTTTEVLNGQEAVEVVLDVLDFTPYATRTKLTHIIDAENNIREGWLVVVRPFGRSYHELFLVDSETKRVERLYE